jgi:uncharacterized protein HemX
MTVVEPTDRSPSASADGRPIRQVLLACLVAVLSPPTGLLAGVLVFARQGRRARRQGALIIALSALLISLGIGLGPMVVDSYFAGKAQHELNAVSSETERSDAESQRELEEQLAQTRREGAATQAHIRALQESQRSHTGRAK